MLYQKRISVGAFLKKGEDIKDNDIVEIASEGKSVEGQYGPQDIFLIKTKSGQEGNVAFNSTSINGLIDAYGKDSLKWIGEQIKAIKIKQNVAGKFIDVWYFSHPDAELTENGFVLPDKGKNAPQIQTSDPEEVRTEDIPF